MTAAETAARERIPVPKGDNTWPGRVGTTTENHHIKQKETSFMIHGDLGELLLK